MDKVKVFKDGLNLPQGIEVVNGGVVVAMVPYLVFFPKTQRRGRNPLILWSGMGPTRQLTTPMAASTASCTAWTTGSTAIPA